MCTCAYILFTLHFGLWTIHEYKTKQHAKQSVSQKRIKMLKLKQKECVCPGMNNRAREREGIIKENYNNNQWNELCIQMYRYFVVSGTKLVFTLVFPPCIHDVLLKDKIKNEVKQRGTQFHQVC